ncbi:MAG: hypothetical protein KDB07_08650, partial [Planctomycetes bacterium]|nr:hypothetical protein [Planctomycetota bacterium]
IARGKLTHPSVKDMTQLPRMTMEMKHSQQPNFWSPENFYPVFNPAGEFMAAFQLQIPIKMGDAAPNPYVDTYPFLQLTSPYLDEPLTYVRGEGSFFHFSSGELSAPLIKFDINVELASPLAWEKPSPPESGAAHYIVEEEDAKILALLDGRVCRLQYAGGGRFTGIGLGVEGACGFVLSLKIGYQGFEKAHFEPDLELKRLEVREIKRVIQMPLASVVDVRNPDGGKNDNLIIGFVGTEMRDELLKAERVKAFDENDLDDFNGVWRHPIYVLRREESGEWLIVANSEYRAVAVETVADQQVYMVQFKERWKPEAGKED